MAHPRRKNPSARRPGIRERIAAADRRLFRRAVRSEIPGADRVLPALSKAADHSILWMGIGLGVGLSDGRFGRRALLRGALSVALASAVTNGIAKRVARRVRPELGETPATRRLVRRPVSGSFPSGHAASAFAFATGMSMERPDLAPPLFALAGTVAYSRVYLGVHYPSDVAVGAAAGTGLAFALRRYWPVAPRQPARVDTGRHPGERLPVGGKGLAIAVNPLAGRALTRDRAAVLRRELPDADVIEVHGGELPAALRKCVDEADVVGIAGGDGSTNTAAAVAYEAGKPLLPIPAGTMNHFAKDLGIHRLEDAVRATRSGRVVGVDVGTIAGRVFVNTASFGAYVDFVDARDRLEERIGKWPAMAVALVRVLRGAEPLEVEIDGERRRVWMVVVGNCRHHPEGFAPSWRDRLEDGILDVRILDASEPRSRPRLVWAVLTGTLAGSRAYESSLTHRLQVRSLEGPLRLARDGETFEGPEEFLIEKANERLQVLIPAENASETPRKAT